MWLPSKGGRPHWRGAPAPQQRWSHPGRGVRGMFPQGWPGTRGDYVIGLESLWLRSRDLGCSDRACSMLRTLTLTYISFLYFTNKWTSFYILFSSSSQLYVWSVMFMIIPFKWWIISGEYDYLFFPPWAHTYLKKKISIYTNLSLTVQPVKLAMEQFLYHPQIKTDVTTWSLTCVCTDVS